MTFDPRIAYAQCGDVNIAYGVVGDGPIDLVIVSGFVSHVEVVLDDPRAARALERLSTFARVIWFDKRGVGLSDPVSEVPTLEQRMEDIVAVLRAVGANEVALFAFSEGGALACLFAATHPHRVTALMLYGAMARSTWAPDYPYASHKDALMEAAYLMQPHAGTGAWAEAFAPSTVDDPVAMASFAKVQRAGASPAMLEKIYRMFLDTDVRSVLPAIGVPTLVLHRRGDRVVNRRAGEYLAANIPGARYVELPGIDHTLWAGDTDVVIDEIERFLTGTLASRGSEGKLATVLFTDIVDSTARQSDAGDARWSEIVRDHDALVRRALHAHRGEEIKTLGDGFLATFDGPARAIRCATEIVDGVRRLGISIRAGLHTGEVRVLPDGDVAGLSVTIAARVAHAAGGGEVLVSRTVKDLVTGSGIAFTPRGAHTLKGVPDEWELFAVERA